MFHRYSLQTVQLQKEQEKEKRKQEKALLGKEEQMNTMKAKLKAFDSKIEKLSFDQKFDEIEGVMKDRKNVERDLEALNKEYDTIFEQLLEL